VTRARAAPVAKSEPVGRHGRNLTRRQLLRGLAGAGVAAAVGRAPRTARAQSRDRSPNILFVLSDNHRWDALGCMRHPFVKTPALDRLAREGVHFPNAFCTTPLCSPARASFLTGLYAWRHGVHNNTTTSRWSEDLVTFLELLKSGGGYATAFVGKWHMPASGLPRLRGVDHFVTFTINDGQGRYFDCPLLVDGKKEESRRSYLTEELTDRSLAFIDAQRERPFCLYLSHKAAHYPWSPAPDLAGIYAREPVELPQGATMWTGLVDGQVWGGFDRSIPSAYRSYMETVTSMDREIGRLLQHLDARGIAGETIIVYASDNGFLFGEHGKVELRWPFEEALRIPLLVRYPRGIASGRAQQMALNIDVAPTLLGLAGLPVPKRMQGMNLVPVLRDQGAPGRRAWLVENWKEFPYRTPTYQGVRTERWLYVEYEGRLAPTLHDLTNDPHQQRNLFGTPQGARVVGELHPLLEALRRGERFDA
jgi:arylsulfatase A-like enzyme